MLLFEFLLGAAGVGVDPFLFDAHHSGLGEVDFAFQGFQKKVGLLFLAIHLHESHEQNEEEGSICDSDHNGDDGDDPAKNANHIDVAVPDCDFSDGYIM